MARCCPREEHFGFKFGHLGNFEKSFTTWKCKDLIFFRADDKAGIDAKLVTVRGSMLAFQELVRKNITIQVGHFGQDPFLLGYKWLTLGESTTHTGLK